jgi:hypothetical protein
VVITHKVEDTVGDSKLGFVRDFIYLRRNRSLLWGKVSKMLAPVASPTNFERRSVSASQASLSRTGLSVYLYFIKLSSGY